MLACSENALERLDELSYPLYVSSKIDGIRCIVQNGKAYSRTMKLIPNRHIQFMLSCVADYLPTSISLDGELTVGDNFQNCTSGIMSEAGEPEFNYWLFDYVGERTYPFGLAFNKRQEQLREWHRDIRFKQPALTRHLNILPQTQVNNREELQYQFDFAVARNFEGLIARTALSPYKQGRATWKEQYMLKLKRFHEAEAVVVDVLPAKKNCNAPTLDERGYTKRSNHIDRKIPIEMIGGYEVVQVADSPGIPKGTGFYIGAEGTHKERKRQWPLKSKLLGRIIKYKYQIDGVKNKPRLPIMVGFRHPIDF
jgi:DNA ligase 1